MMRLRLNGDDSGTSSTIGYNFTNAFEHDVNVSSTTKLDVFQFIGIVIKNLVDKPHEPKYRQLRLNNTKIQRYTSHSSIMNYLQQVIGFDRVVDTVAVGTGSDGEEPMLRIVDESRLPSPDILQEELRAIKAIIQRMETTVGVASSTQPRVISNSSSTASLESDDNGTSGAAVKMSEKQKARLLMEEKMALQKLQDEQARKRTIQQIQNDKFVRQNDPNWKPSVSAAAAKSGDSMSTFRDKFGEN